MYNKFLVPVGADDFGYFDLLEKYKKYVGGVYIGWPDAPSGRSVVNSKKFFDRVYSWCTKNDKVFDILFNMQGHDFKNGFDYEKISLDDYDQDKVELTFSSLMLFKEKKFSGYKRNISVNYKVNKSQQLFFLKKELREINSIIIDRDINRDLDLINEIIRESKRLKINIDVLVNEGCVPFCPNKADHNIFTTLNHYADLESWMKKSKNICRLYYKEVPNIFKSPFITRENLKYYDCRFFKVVGRKKPIDEVDEILDYYINGTAVDIGKAFANIHLKTGVTTDVFNDRFNKSILRCKNNCNGCDFCNTFIKCSKYNDL